MKKRNQLRQRGGKLMFQRHLADPRSRPVRNHRICLPENMEPDILVRGVGRVFVGAPIGGVTVKFHITNESPAIGRGKGGAQEVRPGSMVPNAGMQNPDRLPRQGPERVLDQLLKPDPLKNGFRQNRPRFLPQEVFPDPTPIPQAHTE